MQTMADAFSFDSFTLFFCWLFCGRYGVFGSKVDWISQHSVFPDYFRQQFYDTGDFFPEFAAGIGGGQNIITLPTMDCTVLFFVVLSASFVENERLSDCSILHLPCISSCIALLLAHKKEGSPRLSAF